MAPQAYRKRRCWPCSFCRFARNCCSITTLWPFCCYLSCLPLLLVTGSLQAKLIQELSSALEVILSSSAGPGKADAMFEFMKKAMEFVVCQLRKPVPLDRKVAQMMYRLLLADDDCNFFVCHHGATRPVMPEAEGVDGVFMALPDGGASKFYVGIVNHFGDLGGFDLLINRLNSQVWG